ncbi:MAG TPA: FHA domain-containing protein [Thermoanaerobaculia bacterium]|nr:FHA domain-containing protein [Thermoanaerobaculia bacterium]
MIIQCPSCQAKYQYDEDRFERKPSKKIKCARCGTIFEIRNPAFAERSGTAERPKVDQTAVGQKKSPLPVEDDGPKAPPADTRGELKLPVGKRISLAIIDGPDAGSVFRVEKPRVTIGRQNADFVLNDTEASRQHAALEVRETAFSVVDLGSTNGTLVDGRRIDGPFDLQDKSEFQVGNTTLMLIVTEEM